MLLTPMTRRVGPGAGDGFHPDGQGHRQQGPFVWSQPLAALQQPRLQHPLQQRQQGSFAQTVNHSADSSAAATSGSSSSHCQDVYARVSQSAAAHDLPVVDYLGHDQDLHLDLEDLDLDNLDLDNIPISVLGGPPAFGALQQDCQVSSRRGDVASLDTCQVSSKDNKRITGSRGSSSGSNGDLDQFQLPTPAAAPAVAGLHHQPFRYNNVVGMTAEHGFQELMPQLSAAAVAAPGSSTRGSRHPLPPGQLQVSTSFEQHQHQQQQCNRSHQSSINCPSPPATPATAIAGLTAAMRFSGASGKSHVAHQQQQQQPWVAAFGGSRPGALATAYTAHNLIRSPLSQPTAAPQQQQQHAALLSRPVSVLAGVMSCSDRLIAPTGVTMQLQSLQYPGSSAESSSGHTSAHNRPPPGISMVVPQDWQQQQILEHQQRQQQQQQQLRLLQYKQMLLQHARHHQQQQQQQQVPTMSCDCFRLLLLNHAAAGSSETGAVGHPQVTSPDMLARAHMALQQRLQAAYQAGFSDGVEHVKYVKQHNQRCQLVRHTQQQQQSRQGTPSSPVTVDTPPPAGAPAAAVGDRKRRLVTRENPAEPQHKKTIAVVAVAATAGSSTAQAIPFPAAAAVLKPACDLETAAAAGPPAAANSAPGLCEMLAADPDSAADQLRNMSDSELLLLAAQAINSKPALLVVHPPSNTNLATVCTLSSMPHDNLPSGCDTYQKVNPDQPCQELMLQQAPTSNSMDVDPALATTHPDDGTLFSSAAAALVQQLLQQLQKGDQHQLQ